MAKLKNNHKMFKLNNVWFVRCEKTGGHYRYIDSMNICKCCNREIR
jgi:ribosomal protein S14